jgi:hypothetical protein
MTYVFRVMAQTEEGLDGEWSDTNAILVTAPVKAEPPVVRQPLADVVVGLNQTVKLECVIVGTPSPEIKWFKNGKLLKTKKATFDAGLVSLVVGPTTEASAAAYTCQGTNECGKAETSCRLKIQGTVSQAYFALHETLHKVQNF